MIALLIYLLIGFIFLVYVAADTYKKEHRLIKIQLLGSILVISLWPLVFIVAFIFAFKGITTDDIKKHIREMEEKNE